jgi:hypothetical protein
MFSLRIVTINYYMLNPEAEFDQIYSDFRRSEIKQVPILRIFGSTPDGDLIFFYFKFSKPFFSKFYLIRRKSMFTCSQRISILINSIFSMRRAT